MYSAKQHFVSRIFYVIGLPIEKVHAPVMSFERWQEEIEAGEAHGTCGAKLKRGKVFGKVGKRVYKLLREEGMKRDSVCVDYGCGSLRIGVHTLKYLDPGALLGFGRDGRILRSGGRPGGCGEDRREATSAMRVRFAHS